MVAVVCCHCSQCWQLVSGKCGLMGEGSDFLGGWAGVG